MNEIANIIKRLVKPMIPVQVMRGKVTAINKDQDTCDIEPLRGGAEYLDVRLKAVIEQTDVRLIVYPTIGSIVHFGIIENNKADTFITQITEFESILIQNKTKFKLHLNSDGKLNVDAEEIVFNGGQNKGLVKQPELVKELNKNNQLLKAMIAIFNGTPIIEAGNGSPSALQVALKTSVAGKSIGNFSNIENPKIKH